MSIDWQRLFVPETPLLELVLRGTIMYLMLLAALRVLVRRHAARAPSTLETTTDDYARFMTTVLRGDGLSEASWNKIFKPQVRIRSRTQFGPGASETTAVNDSIELSYGIGWGLQRTPHGWGAFKEGRGDGFQHYSIVYPAKKLGVLLMSNSDNAESVFGRLLPLTVADTFTPLEWENYVPYDRAPSAAR